MEVETQHNASPSVAGQKIDSGLICLLMMARYFNIPAEAKQLEHELARPGLAFDTATILRAAKYLRLKAKALQSNWQRLADTTLPAIAQDNDGRYFILAKIVDNKVLVHEA